ncbi:MAG: DEAD/DEAH box helicase, partial [Spirochaetales bacterium]|nr:DEAD/DEAH box helicase [Spirochaetales bacterium]
QDNLLLAAGTASGKTEAAFLPALTEIYNKPSSSIGILYISPLKALINDQFARLELLLEDSHIPVWKWHGEASQTKNRKALEQPQGVMQTTPESLEALLKSRHGDVIKLFSDLRFIIIDEVHAFMGSDRGLQLLSIMQIMSRLTKNHPRRIGLSATMGDYTLAEAWLSNGSPYKCVTPLMTPAKQKVRLGIAYIPCPIGDDHKTIDTAPFYEYMYQLTDGRKSIIFANEKQEVETNIGRLTHLNQEHKGNNQYFVHHGSIAAGLRESAEDNLKNADMPTTVSATVTLELGIDIGSLDIVIQTGSPWTVSAFVQRLGRSGRRTGMPQMCFLFHPNSEELSPTDLSQIRWDFLKAIAIIKLYTEQRWIEPPSQQRCPYSVLYQQIMSILYGQGEMKPAELAQTMLTLDVFRHISKEDFRIFLRHLIDTEHLEKTETGTLIIGTTGEKVVNFFDFIAVFKTPQEYTVKHGNQTIGTVDQEYSLGYAFALGGLNWKVIEINDKSHVLFVEPIVGYAETKWRSRCIFITHTKIMQTIREILLSDEPYPFLNESAAELLAVTRNFIRRTETAEKPLHKISSDQWALYPWLGTKAVNALYAWFTAHDLGCKIH